MPAVTAELLPLYKITLCNRLAPSVGATGLPRSRVMRAHLVPSMGPEHRLAQTFWVPVVQRTARRTGPS
jgi:hypothetical protein